MPYHLKYVITYPTIPQLDPGLSDFMDKKQPIKGMERQPIDENFSFALVEISFIRCLLSSLT